MQTTTPHIVMQIQISPFKTAYAREILDTALMLASFEIKLQLIFRDAGIWQLVQTQETPIQAMPITPILTALAHYDIHDVFALDSSLATYGIQPSALLSDVRIINQQDVNQLIHSADYCYAFSL